MHTLTLVYGLLPFKIMLNLIPALRVPRSTLRFFEAIVANLLKNEGPSKHAERRKMMCQTIEAEWSAYEVVMRT